MLNEFKLINHGERSVKAIKLEGFDFKKRSFGRELKEINQVGLKIQPTKELAHFITK